MRLAAILVGGVVLLFSALLLLNRLSKSEPPVKVVTAGERLPLCPWREPERDLQHFFPGATGFVTESRGVSHAMADLRKRMGRPLETDENPLRIHRVEKEGTRVGAILVRRVKGEHGGIEIVSAMDTNGAVRGVRIQSHREPSVVAQAITNPAWLGSFVGKTGASAFRVAEDLGPVPAEARASANAVAEGVRGQITVLRAAELSLDAQAAAAHTNH